MQSYKVVLLILNYFIANFIESKMIIDDLFENDPSVEIINKYFNDRSCLTIIKIDNVITSVNVMNINPNVTKKILSVTTDRYNSTFIPASRPRRDELEANKINQIFDHGNIGFLIFSKNINSLKTYIFGARVSPFLTPQNNFFIILTKAATIDEINSFYETSWNLFKTPNVVITNGSIFYFHNPMIKNVNDWGKTFVYNISDVKNDNKLIINDLLDFNGYPLRTIIFHSVISKKVTDMEYQGVDAETLRLLIRYMNCTNVVYENVPDYFHAYASPNGSVFGSMKYVVNNQIDFLSVAHFLKYYFTSDIEFSSVFLQDSLCILIRNSKVMQVWEVLTIYHEVWILLFCSYFLITVVWYVFKKIDLINSTSDSIFLETLRIIILNSVMRNPVLISERVFLMFCMMSMITLFGAIQGSLVMIFTSPIYHPNIKTLSELAEKNYTIVTQYEDLRNEAFSDHSNSSVMMKLQKMIRIADVKVENISDFLTNNVNTGTLSRKISANLNNFTRAFDKFGNNILHLIEECPRNLLLIYILPVKSYCGPRINDIILRATEAGLYVKWYNDQKWNMTVDSREATIAKERTIQQNKHKIFKINDLSFAFYILLIGHSTSLIFFIVETTIKFLSP